MALSHNNLESYYISIFSLAQHHKYSITEIENLLPFERDIYIELLSNYIQQVEQSKKSKSVQFDIT